jgi:hypothetical protein
MKSSFETGRRINFEKMGKWKWVQLEGRGIEELPLSLESFGRTPQGYPVLLDSRPNDCY